ncbi:MAG TPA: hypothetical protein VM638_07925 [Actinomycetota bacterium]|nr:hypothetical protein [Actinomycetota bacterium]
MLRRLLRPPAPGFGNEDLPDVAASQWWSRDRILDYQAERLRRLVAYVWEEVPFYRDLMREHRVRPADVQGPDDLHALPVVEKSVLHGHAERITRQEAVHEYALTGGTSGFRLRWARNRRWLELFTACLYRGFGWAGLTKETKVVSFYSRNIGTVSERALILRESLEAGRVETELEEVRAFGPEAAYCYASSAFMVASYLLDTGQTLPLRTVVTTGDQLLPEYVPVIERAFGCRVWDNFGCNDGGVWGAQCEERSGFHHDAERSILEVVDGRLVATDLWNSAFPFLRYAIGDAGAWLEGDCPCGRGSPRFTAQGRLYDVIVGPTAALAPPAATAMFRVDGLADFRIVQTDPRTVEVLVVRASGFDAGGFDRGIQALREALPGMEVVPRFVETIAPTTSGKRRIVENRTGLSPASVWGGPTPADGP